MLCMERLEQCWKRIGTQHTARQARGDGMRWEGEQRKEIRELREKEVWGNEDIMAQRVHSDTRKQ